MNASKLFKVLVVGGAAMTAGVATQAGCASDDPEPAPTGTSGTGSAGAAGAASGGAAGQSAAGAAGTGDAGAAGTSNGGAAGASSGGAAGASSGGAAGTTMTGSACVDQCATQQVSPAGACVGFPCCWETAACCSPCCAK